MDDKLITVAEFQDNPLDGQMAKSALEDHGIKAIIVGDNVHGLLPVDGMMYIQLKVFEKDLPQATKVLEDMQNTTDDQQETVE